MKKNTNSGLRSSLVTLGTLALVGSLAACSGSREIEVEGEVAAPSSVTGPISVEFFDVADDEEISVLRVEVAEAGAFKQTVEVEGDAIRIFALADADADGACTEGEAWGEIEAAVTDDDTVAPVALELAIEACPASASPPAEGE
jgi:hypothetical protein